MLVPMLKLFDAERRIIDLVKEGGSPGKIGEHHTVTGGQH